jgi:hypothetical protein
MPHRWKSAKDADSHTMLGKASQERLGFPTFPQARRLEQPKNQMHLNTYKGWMRDQEEVAKPPYRADGVVLARFS